jgi:hypothetical protein
MSFVGDSRYPQTDSGKMLLYFTGLHPLSVAAAELDVPRSKPMIAIFSPR